MVIDEFGYNKGIDVSGSRRINGHKKAERQNRKVDLTEGVPVRTTEYTDDTCSTGLLCRLHVRFKILKSFNTFTS